MRRVVAAGFLLSVLFVAGAGASAATPRATTRVPDFVQAKLNEFEACVQKQGIRVIPTIPPPDKRMELCGANFMWLRQNLTTVRKCLKRGKVFSVEKLPSYKTPDGFAFSIFYDCAIPRAWLNIEVETRGDSARVAVVGEAME